VLHTLLLNAGTATRLRYTNSQRMMGSRIERQLPIHALRLDSVAR